MPQDEYNLEKRIRTSNSHKDWEHMKASTHLPSLIAYFCIMINNEDVRQDEHRFRFTHTVYFNDNPYTKVIEINTLTD